MNALLSVRAFAFRAAGIRLLLLAILLAACGLARGEDTFLEPERAFVLSGRAIDARQVEIRFDIAPGYYLYGDKFHFAAEGVTLGPAVLPQGKIKFDETFQKDVETHRDTIRIVLPVEQAAGDFKLAVTSQGCADQGLCYPPQEQFLAVSLAGFGGDGTVRLLAATEPSGDLSTLGAAGAPPSAAASVDPVDAALRGGRFWTIVGVFFVAGVLLSFTPCVLPMLPILSSLIAGQGESVSRGRGLALAASYSLGMALVYTLFGIAAGLVGEGLAATLQKPWVLGLFALGLLALAGSMFGFYELRLPNALQGHAHRASSKLPAGRIAGVFAMGGLSALIVSPCVVAPLAGALVYLSQTRDVMLGGTALFSLASGMSVPLLVLGVSEGALLPRAGAWMEGVKQFFGVLLVGVAIWTIQPVLPGPLSLALWAVLLVGSAVALVEFRRAGRRPLWRLIAASVAGLIGVMQLLGAASGGTDPLQPLRHLAAASPAANAATLRFAPVRSVAELDSALSSAGRPVMLDFYADWCVSCKEMERFTFADPGVRDKLAGALLLKADVTANNPQDRELLRRFNLFGPPGTIFFDAQGREIEGTRVIGFQDAERFTQTLRTVGL
ncbi:MAG TPA: protein-disulfide reductase DsbD [Burkholderiaceae bacterium]|nr:protein-disulfide reductase DsbD [Burkholderiaceae bacterium]